MAKKVLHRFKNLSFSYDCQRHESFTSKHKKTMLATGVPVTILSIITIVMCAIISPGNDNALTVGRKST
jgi:hypothetical protein